MTGSSHKRLRASEFVAGNPTHLAQLTAMGIRIVKMPDGRVQFFHTATEVQLVKHMDFFSMFLV